MPFPLILDTDIDTDCDDVGALAMLHALADNGEVNIAGIICDAPTPWGAPCIQAINHYYGRAEIPVGAIRVDDFDTNRRYDLYREHIHMRRDAKPYNEVIAQSFSPGAGTDNNIWDGVAMYRKLLSAHTDHSVVIIAVGLLTVLESLLKSEPDEYSPLHGMQLVETKVRMLVTMGVGSFPQGCDCFNWSMDKTAAARVLNDWPTTLVVSEWGENILTGASLAHKTPPTNPVRRAYEIYFQGAGKSRSSWDQMAVLYSVRGAREYFSEITGHHIHFSATTGEHQWTPVADGIEHIYLQQIASNEALAETIEDLMTQAPLRK